MTTDRRFSRFDKSPATAAFSVTEIPDDGMCLSAFLILTEARDSRKVLMGHMNPKAPWDHIGALDPSRVEAHSHGWMLPSSHLIFRESPDDAARRIAREQLELPDLALTGPTVVSEVYTPKRFPGQAHHWDLNLVFIGHVDHGKSTTVGRILYDTGNIDPHELENLKKLAEQMGKATFEFAFVMDQVKEERERGLTIDVAHKRFDTDKYYFTIIDAPGHRDFVKNMITGTSQADAAVLVVGGVEGVQTQTKEHIFLARTLGVEQLIVAINKMDATKPPFAEARFNELKAELTGLLKGVGYKVDKVPFIPISSYKGENITKASSKMAWYKGPALVEALNSLTVPPKPTNLPLRLPVQDVYSITG